MATLLQNIKRPLASLSLQSTVSGLQANPAQLEAGLVTGKVPAEWMLGGEGLTRSKLLGTTEDKLAYVMYWECNHAHFNWSYGKDEFVILLSGETFVSQAGGPERRFGSGDVIYFPAGSKAVWRIPDHVRKIAIIKPSIIQPFAFLARAWMKLLVLAGLSKQLGH